MGKQARELFVDKHCISRIKWRISGKTIHVGFSDKSSDWSAKFSLESNRKLRWRGYCYWNSAAARAHSDERIRRRTAEFSRVLSPSLALASALEEHSVRLSALEHLDPFVGGVPEELVDEVRLTPEHFPDMVFYRLPELSWLL